MKIGQQFNTLTLKEYLFYVDNHKKYTDFNTLGLYRSLLENNKLDISQKIEVRDYAHTVFKKSFDFLQIKDPVTFVDVNTIGQELTIADKEQLWDDLRTNQQKILSDKKIKHRNFGTYSKHLCGHDDCPYQGVMLKKGKIERNMRFDCDKRSYGSILKSEIRKVERKTEYSVIKDALVE